MTAYEMRISDWSSDVCSSDLSLKLKLASGREIAVWQIAGLVARRILCEAREGQQLKAGERFGLIRFGSRVDVYLDDAMVPLVCVGQTMIGGETVIAEDGASEQPRTGEEIGRAHV